MTIAKQEFVAAWRPNATDEAMAPGGGVRELGCVYDLYIGIDTIDEAVYFVRRGPFDELWAEDGIEGRTWRAVRMKHNGLGRRASCLTMFERFVRARSGFGGPSGMQVPGLIEALDLQDLIERMDAEWKSAQRAAQAWRAAPLVRVAEALKLSPRPSGGNPWSWEASCPGANHSMMLQAKRGEWGCGWCKRKGGVEELRQFVGERGRRVLHPRPGRRPAQRPE